MAIATDKVTGRRPLSFSDYQQILDDVHALAGRPTQQLGNWTLGQICDHLAKTIDTTVEGPAFPTPWYLRLVGPLLKRRFISRPMSPGFRLPKNAAPLLPASVNDAAGLTALENSIRRLLATSETQRNAVFGAMTRAEWDQLHFRHAEMHLSFIVPAG